MADRPQDQGNSRDVRIGRIISELHNRRRRGEPIDRTQVLAAHLDLAEDLRDHLAVMDKKSSQNDDSP